MNLHFWYLYFVSIVLAAKVVPGPGACGSIRARVHQGGGGAVLAPVHHRPLLDAVHTDGYAAIGID